MIKQEYYKTRKRYVEAIDVYPLKYTYKETDYEIGQEPKTQISNLATLFKNRRV